MEVQGVLSSTAHTGNSVLPVACLVKAGTGLNATFGTGDLSLSYSQLSMHEHYPCTHLVCWQTFNVIQCRLTQERADLAASLVQLGEKRQNSIQKQLSRADCLCMQHILDTVKPHNCQ